MVGVSLELILINSTLNKEMFDIFADLEGLV